MPLFPIRISSLIFTALWFLVPDISKGKFKKFDEERDLGATKPLSQESVAVYEADRDGAETHK